jgi:uncharacterized protein YraI
VTFIYRCNDENHTSGAIVRVRDASAWRSVKPGRLTRKPLFIAAVAMRLASAFSARAEYVCVPPTIGGESTLQLRTGPGFNYPGKPMANGTVVTVVKPPQGDWVEVRRVEGETGWAYRQRVCPGTGPKR